MTSPFSARQWRLARGRSLTLGPKGHLMAVINLTPDSFSDGGVHAEPAVATQAATRMITDGATIVDLGAESTRPGAEPVDGETERARLLPAMRMLAETCPEAIISVDTYRAATAAAALEAGAHIVNDVWGVQREPDIARAAAAHGAGLVIMHTGRDREPLPDPIEDQRVFLSRSVEIALEAGVGEGRIVLDPGFGFAKDTQTNLALMDRFDVLHALGFPLLVGTSRKRFIGAVTGRQVERRDTATAATTALLRARGAAIFRVHDVAANRDALAMADAMLAMHRPDRADD